MEYHRGEENLARVGDLHRKIGAGLWHKGDREGSIEHYQRGIDLLKDGPPCLELVRLYEEAASLYMHTGDNMLAIYASEKALRLAERLGEAAAASRAHGIFGRVFGRIGDSERARENLERSVELARESGSRRGGAGAAGARLPPRDLRGRLRGGARARTATRSRSPCGPATCPRRSSCTPRSPRSPPTAGEWEAAEESTDDLAGARRARGADRQALLPVLDARRDPLARRRPRRGGRAARPRRRFGRAGRPLGGRVRVPARARGRAARSRRPRGRRPGARARARPLRTRRPGRPVGRGDRDPGGQPGRSGARPRRRREVAEEATGLAERLRYPVGTRRGARGARRGRRGRRRARRGCWARRATPGATSVAPGRRRALRDADRGGPAMSAWREQALIEAPVGAVWELVGNPERYPEWAGNMVAVTGLAELAENADLRADHADRRCSARRRRRSRSRSSTTCTRSSCVCRKQRLLLALDPDPGAGGDLRRGRDRRRAHRAPVPLLLRRPRQALPAPDHRADPGRPAPRDRLTRRRTADRSRSDLSARPSRQEQEATCAPHTSDR